MLKKQTVKKYMMLILKIALIAILIFNVTTAFLSLSGLNAHLDIMPFAIVSVEGGSMAPEFGNGDLIVVKKQPYAELQIGDNVTFLTDKGLVTHRIVEMSEGEYVTRGISNQINDTYTMGVEEYCGKVIMSIPFLGYGIQILSASRLSMILCVFLIIALCFGRIILRRLAEMRKKAQRGDKKKLSFSTRTISCLCAVSCLICVPYITDTQYIGELNRADIAVAQPLYLSSNYLAEGDGNKYNIMGWNGKAYSFNLQIANYTNELLYNPDDIDVKYGVGIKRYAGDGYSDQYTLSVTYPEGVAPLASGDFEYPENWSADGIIPNCAYSLTGGSPQSHMFKILITPNTEGTDPLPANTKIRFEVYATTELGKNYSIKMLGCFELQVAESFDFIGTTSTNELSTMVTLNVKTNLINDGTDEKVVLFQWDPDFLYINEFESTVFNYISKNGNACFDKTNGRLWMKTQAYANINLEFFKKEVDLDEDDDGENEIVPNYNITVQVVEGVGQLPTPPPAPPQTPTE